MPPGLSALAMALSSVSVVCSSLLLGLTYDASIDDVKLISSSNSNIADNHTETTPLLVS